MKNIIDYFRPKIESYLHETTYKYNSLDELLGEGIKGSEDAFGLFYSLYQERIYNTIVGYRKTVYMSIVTDIDQYYPQIPSSYLNPKQLQEEYGFSISWQEKARKAGKIPYHKISSRHIRYKRVDIDSWIDEHKII